MVRYSMYYYHNMVVSMSTRTLLQSLGNTKKVKLKLWELVIVFNNNFYSATNLCHATLRQIVAGNSTFRGIVFCNLGTPKPVISNFVTMWQIETPYLSR